MGLMADMSWNNMEEQKKTEYREQQDDNLLSYTEVIRSALSDMMARDPNIFIMGQGVNDKCGMFGMTDGLSIFFGTERVFDTPLAETGLTGVAVGAAMAGQRPVYFHNRPDFLYLAMDQLINHAAKYHYMSGGQYKIPLILWAVTGQGWGSAAQHSQSIHGMLMNVPGLKIAMPATPYDVKGLLVSALEDHNPVLFLDHRRLHAQKAVVPQELYRIPFGRAVIRRPGKDITIVGISAMVEEALKASELLEQSGVSAEVIDLRTLKPFDRDMIVNSVRKTGRLLIADTGGECCGAAAEIAVKIYAEAFDSFKAPAKIVALEDVPTPAAYNLEELYYQNCKDIYERAMLLFQ